MKRTRPHVDINLQELYAVLDQARRSPLSDPDYQKLVTALQALADLAKPAHTTEKTESVLSETARAASPERFLPAFSASRSAGTKTARARASSPPSLAPSSFY